MVWRYLYKDVLPFVAMVGVECTTVLVNTLFKAATLQGLSFYVFVCYSYAAATLVLLPFAFISGSARTLPSSKSSLIFRIFLLALIGVSDQMAGYKGIQYSSPTLSSAISNLIPAFTFILAVLFRMERVVLRSSTTLAKIIGTIVSISGALLVVLYKGPTIFSAASSTPSPSLYPSLDSTEPNWIAGGILLATQCLLIAVWYIVQTQIMEMYPAELTVVFFYNLCATLISAPVFLLAQPDVSAWRLKPGVELTAVICSGFFGTSFGSTIHTWGLHLKGPVYISVFKPLSIAIAAAMGAIFLGDALHLGSVIGSVILCVGFYAVIWGKAKEEAAADDTGRYIDKLPLLQDNRN